MGKDIQQNQGSEQGNFFQLPNVAVDVVLPKVGPTAFAVLVYLVKCARRKGRFKHKCWPAVETITLDMRLSRATVERAKAKLKSAGAINIRRRGPTTAVFDVSPLFERPATGDTSNQKRSLTNDTSFPKEVSNLKKEVSNLSKRSLTSETQNNRKEQEEENNTKLVSKGFRKPTFDEVSSYCKERQNQVDPQTFIDHYTSNGWKVGRNPMKDWKAAVRTWERNAGKFTNATTSDEAEKAERKRLHQEAVEEIREARQRRQQEARSA